MMNSLREYGLTCAESARLKQLTLPERYRELKQGLEAYTNEVLADKPVSALYHYWIGPSDAFFTAPPQQSLHKDIYDISRQFDDQERAGVPRDGFETVKKLIIENPQSVVLWYSPPGPASFDRNSDNPYSAIQYDYGQLYIHYSDREKVNAVAVKISNPEALSLWIPDMVRLSQPPSQDEITRSLLTPVVFQGSIDEFLARQDQSEFVVYTDKKGVQHSLKNVIHNIQKTFAGKTDMQLPDFEKTIGSLADYEITEQKVLTIYLATIQSYQQASGLTVINLSGSCGGTTVNSLNINQILLELSQTPNLPSIAQLLNPSGSKSRTLDTFKTLDCTCPFCKEKVKAQIQDNRISCPKCHKEAQYAC